VGLQNVCRQLGWPDYRMYTGRGDLPAKYDRELDWADTRRPVPHCPVCYLSDLRRRRSMSRGFYGVVVLPLNVNCKFFSSPSNHRPAGCVLLFDKSAASRASPSTWNYAVRRLLHAFTFALMDVHSNYWIPDDYTDYRNVYGKPYP